MKRSIIWIIIIVLLAGTVWKLASNKRTQEEQVYRHDRNAPVHVSVDTVRAIAFATRVRYSGSIEAVHEGKVMAEVPGRIVALEVKEGRWVEKGKVIARLDGDLLRLQLKAAEVQVEGLEKDQQRYSVLAKADAIQGVQLEKTELGLRAARIQLNTLQEQVQRTAIVAPFSGFVAQLFVDVGTVLNPSMPVALLSDDRSLELVVSVPGTEIQAFSAGQTVPVMIGGSGTQVNGVVESVGSRGDMAHNFTVRIVLQANKEMNVKPGMAASVRSSPQGAATLPTIPASAVFGSTLAPEVYVVKNGVAQRISISTTSRDAGRVAVSEGLQAGDLVVTGGFINLSDGTPVKY
ncbi:MAG: efflux RND transporter periplasmic adaptor subunit [Flavobacteriales bacterium]|nr:efflux RND transporter periplasmic adaptor subunit [Flavobacteriales bacterium]